jgi:general secretion pathway protein B
MSYILDALKKADRERDLGEVPDLETAHWRARRHPRPQLWVWIVGALLLFNGLLIVFVLLDRDSGDVPRVADMSRSESAPPERKPVVPLSRAPVDAELPVTTRPRVPVRPPVRQPPRQASPAPSRVQTPVIPPASQPPQASTGEFDLPEWRELSLEFRSGLSLPRIDVHVYAEDPARRFIMADLKKYREGETLANGALLEKIHPGSIQLNYQGTRFRVER